MRLNMKGKNDLKRFAQLMSALSGVFDSKEKPSALKIELYFKALEDLTIKQIEGSATKIMRNRIYPSMPLPAHIRENADLQQLLDSLSAWILVEKCLEGGPKPTDPVVNKAVDTLGGYERLGYQSYEQLVWTQKDFERRYELINQRRDIYELPAPQKDHLKIVKKNL